MFRVWMFLFLSTTWFMTMSCEPLFFQDGCQSSCKEGWTCRKNSCVCAQTRCCQTENSWSQDCQEGQNPDIKVYCIDLKSRNDHCGECGNPCPKGTNCEQGRCVCAEKKALCKQQCIDLQTNKSHCGECGKSCQDGMVCCQGQCVKDTTTNPYHCGACGLSCKSGESCCGGTCVEAKLTNPNHCGFCGNVCQSGEDCCGGLCKQVANDRLHCGSCGNVCKGAALLCVKGRCVCPNQDLLCANTCIPRGETCVESLIVTSPIGSDPGNPLPIEVGGDIALDSIGNIYIAGSTRVYHLRPKQTNFQLTVLAGTETAGYKNGPAKTAQFYSVAGIAWDNKENLYVADSGNHMIRVIRPIPNTQPQQFKVVPLAGLPRQGFKNGPASQALFRFPEDVALDKSGNVYIADSGNHCIRVVRPIPNTSPQRYKVETLAGTGKSGFKDGLAHQAHFNNPGSVAVTQDGRIYVLEPFNHRIRVIRPISMSNPKQYVVETVAGTGIPGVQDGHSSQSTFQQPTKLAVDNNGNVFVADWRNNKIRVIRPIPGTEPQQYQVETLAGTGERGFQDGIAKQSQFSVLKGIAVDKNNQVFVTDNGRIRKVHQECPLGQTLCNGECVSLLTSEQHCGYCGHTCNAGTSCHSGRCTCKAGTFCVITLAGTGQSGFNNGSADMAQFNSPRSVAATYNNQVYVADSANSKIREIVPKSGTLNPTFRVETLAGSTFGHKDGPAKQAQFRGPFNIIADEAGQLYANAQGIMRIVRPIEGTLPKQYTVKTINELTKWSSSSALAVDTKGNIFTTDIHKGIVIVARPKANTTPTKYDVQVLAGTGVKGYKDGPALQSQFQTPWDVAVGADGSVYVSDSFSSMIRAIRPIADSNPTQFSVETIAGTGSRGFSDGPALQAQFNALRGITITHKGSLVVADTFNHRIRWVEPVPNTSPQQYKVSTLAGSGMQGFRDGPAKDAQFNLPSDVSIDSRGHVYIADPFNHRIRVVYRCNKGESLCGLTCTNLTSNSSHCGACKAACQSGYSCQGGKCTLSCPKGQTGCLGKCYDLKSVNFQTDSNHCGTCGVACPSGYQCVGGRCTLSCPKGQSDCFGSCTDVFKDKNNCGSCGNNCASGVCTSGKCLPCPNGQTECYGICKTQTQQSHECR